jgi:DNA-binding transcriptional MocR family regulator
MKKQALTKKSHPTPAIQKAVDYIQDRIQRGEWSTTGRLPSTRLLARLAGVSLSSIVGAIARLKSSNVIAGVERGMICIAGYNQANFFSPAGKKEIWQARRALLEADIRSGVYTGTGKLPLRK